MSPRNKLLDTLAPYPALRKVVQRLPAAVVSTRAAFLAALLLQQVFHAAVGAVGHRLRSCCATQRPKPVAHGHVVAFTEQGKVVADLQCPGGTIHATTAVLETPQYLFISSLKMDTLPRLSTKNLGLPAA